MGVTLLGGGGAPSNPLGGAKGRRRYCVEFNGVGYINCGSDASLDNLHAADFTVDCWFRVDAVDGGGFFAAKGIYGGSGWCIDLLTDEVSFDAFYSLAQAYAETGHVVTLGTWAHLACVFCQSSDLKPYIAVGGVWASYTSQIAARGTPLSDAATPLYIGRPSYGPPTDAFPGFLQWLRVSSGIRYPVGVPFTPPPRRIAPAVDGSTVELWRMDEGAGAVAAAAVVPASAGAMTNCVWGRA